MSRFLRFFDANSGFWRTVSSVWDVIGLSFLWAVCCLPIVTIGPASAALYTAVNGCVRQMKDGAFTAFFKALRANLKTGILTTLLVVPFSLLCAWCCWIIWQMAQSGAPLASGVWVAALIICWFLLGAMCYIFPTLGRFDYTVGGLLKISIQLSVAYLPTTLLLGMMTALAAVLMWRIWCLFLIVPGVLALLASFLLERIYKKHI